MTAPEKPWYTSLLCEFLRRDVPEFVGISPAALSRDILTLENRVAMEGESFLTKTLPSFGKAFDLALQGDQPLAVSGFKKRSRRSALPAFLQALLELVFQDDGHLLVQPCPRAITAVRQLLLWCKKVEKGFTDESLQKAVEDFVSIDAALPSISLHTNPRLLGLARYIISRVLGECPGIRQCTPRHGPGAVAWGVGADGKRIFTRSYLDLERVFRPIPWFFSLRDVSENPSIVTSRFRSKYGLSRLAFVEKDSSGPRLIGLEPAEYMWCQQGIKSWLYNHIEKRSIAKGQINFTDQEVNRKLTSLWSKYDTLDMSKASDRNSLSLVRFLFGKTKLWPYLEASRTPGVVLPSGEILFYKKFAPMGSAVCFPVEAMVFYALAVSSLVKSGYPLSLALRNTFVYGDDLVVPHGYFATLTDDFESVGLKFSEGKCCVSGKFRESCGLDSFDGHDVTPVRLRKPHLARGDLDLVSLVEHANRLMFRGYQATSRYFRKLVKSRFSFFRKARIPLSPHTNLPFLTWLDDQDTVKYFYKDSLRFAKGWAFRPAWEEGSDVGEAFYLRESLSLGGPVGELSRRNSNRSFALRFRGSLRKKKFVVTDEQMKASGLEPHIQLRLNGDVRHLGV